jgi:DNA-binding response OmpR family regulator
MAELSMAEFVSATSNVRRSVLTITAPERQQLFRTILRDAYTLVEAASAADGMAKIAAVSPDLVVIDREGLDIDGLEVCRKLRANGLNMPIIVIGEHLRRSRDRVEITAAGADACLQRPIDGRLLKLEIKNLLHRYDAKADRLHARMPDSKIIEDLNRKGRTGTADPEYFFQRLEQETKYSSENGLSFSVILLQATPAGSQGLNDSVKVAESLIRECDLVFTSDNAVAILLAEADESGASAFLKGFNQLHKSELPRVTCRFYQQQPDFIREIEHLLDEAINSNRAWEKTTLARSK